MIISIDSEKAIDKIQHSFMIKNSPEALPNPWIKLRSPALHADSLPSEPPGKPAINPMTPLK